MWNPLVGRNTRARAERRTFPASRSLSTALETLSAEVNNPRRDVPITASGPQGEQPLLNMNNADKGSRQIGPVTLGKRLALVLRGIGNPAAVLRVVCSAGGLSQDGLPTAAYCA